MHPLSHSFAPSCTSVAPSCTSVSSSCTSVAPSCTSISSSCTSISSSCTSIPSSRNLLAPPQAPPHPLATLSQLCSILSHLRPILSHPRECRLATTLLTSRKLRYNSVSLTITPSSPSRGLYPELSGPRAKRGTVDHTFTLLDVFLPAHLIHLLSLVILPAFFPFPALIRRPYLSKSRQQLLMCTGHMHCYVLAYLYWAVAQAEPLLRVVESRCVS
ncbi:uncharacterized protein F5891DRAFT_1067821 [Suillus fuscotomentosus]|uniref:Uncharacterized protein n=1 Tax=Suillus fuscotomentosus TaxID=1912939 RepID=A0AAD4DSH3_9AGAM|nr:uncharacterized protein F5891DRAFT_1067821 [Suillus fuscotomentosus]KAG1893057.1 hypothetical protein F5891DRAFT_1067821 [Suillus fuscotomentosus]